MSVGLDFAGLQAWLRPPRTAIAIPQDHSVLHAAKALEFFSQIWGGSEGIVLPVVGGDVHPAVSRLARRYDPDYASGVGENARTRIAWCTPLLESRLLPLSHRLLGRQSCAGELSGSGSLH